MQLSLQNIETQKKPTQTHQHSGLNFSNPNLLSSCTGDTAFTYIFLYTKRLSLLTFYSLLQKGFKTTQHLRRRSKRKVKTN